MSTPAFQLVIDHVVDDTYANQVVYWLTITSAKFAPLPETPNIEYWLGEWEGCHGSAAKNIHFTLYEAGKNTYGAQFYWGHDVNESTLKGQCITHQTQGDIVSVLQRAIVNAVLANDEAVIEAFGDTVVLKHGDRELEDAKDDEAATWQVYNAVTDSYSMVHQEAVLAAYLVRDAMSVKPEYEYVAVDEKIPHPAPTSDGGDEWASFDDTELVAARTMLPTAVRDDGWVPGNDDTWSGWGYNRMAGLKDPTKGFFSAGSF
jgi:hypothetical protein